MSKCVIRPFNCGLLSSYISELARGMVVALAPSELVRLRRRRGRGGYVPCRPGHCIARLVDVFAGVMVLSEVAQRLMMMSGSDASTSAAGYSQAATSRMNEVATTPSQRDIASPADRTRNFTKSDQASFAWPQSNDVPSTQMQ
jgi:hypothetical protein